MAVRLAEEWFAICGGCEVTILDIGEPLIEVLKQVEIVHMPVIMDHKTYGQTGESTAMEIPEADIGLISGGIRNDEHKKLAQEMRKKCKILVASGMPTDSFVFHGFLPSKLGQRRKLLEEIQHSARTQIFYEAPHRLLGTLEDIVDVLGPQRRVVVAREVTKIYEEFLRVTAAEAYEDFKKREEVREEITLLIGRAEEQHGLPAVKQKNARTRVRELMKAEEIDEKEAMKRVAKEMGISKSDVYRELQKDGKK